MDAANTEEEEEEEREGGGGRRWEAGMRGMVGLQACLSVAFCSQQGSTDV